MKALRIIMLSTLVMGLVVVSALWHNQSPALAQEKQYKIAVVVHGSDTDPFWKPVKKGVEDASSLYTDLKVTYTGTTAYSLEGFMGNLRSALEAKPDALVCTLTEPDAMDETLRGAIGAGLPVIGINAPDLREPVDARIPVLTYVGEDSYLVGVIAAKETLKRFTPKQAVFCNFHPGAANILARGQGWIDTMKAKGIPVEAIDISADPAKWAKIVAAYLKEHPETDALFISNTGVAQAIIEYLQAAGIDVGSRIKIAQMDVSPRILDYIQQGKIMFTLDQQPYLQGYLGVVFAYLNLKYGFTPPPAPVSTGPAIITKAEINPTKSY